MRRLGVAVTAGLIAIAGLSGCSSSPTTTETPAASMSAMPSASAADIAFAQSMIPHHEQAVEMADLALSSQADASPQVKQLAEQIKAAQGPEIEQMQGWLQEWGAPSAMPGMDHSGHDMADMGTPGMMSDEQMTELESESGEQFDTQWLNMMIAHHKGAIEMAKQVKASSSDPQVTAMADQIIAAQEKEIAHMEQLLEEGQ